MDREQAKAAIGYLAEPMARFALKRLREAHAAWRATNANSTLLAAVTALAADFTKSDAASVPRPALARETLDPICFEYVRA